MRTLQDATNSMLRKPTPAVLVELHGAVLVSGERSSTAERALTVASQFYAYLCELESKVTAKDFSELASRLDMGAVGMVALENLVAADRENLLARLLLGGLGEGLMVAASRQYIKAWATETDVVHMRAAWDLAEDLWQASNDTQPELPAEKRWQSIQALLAPVRDPRVPEPDKAQLVGRIFQTLLLVYVSRLLVDTEAKGQ